MSEWLNDLLTQPIRDNPYELALVGAVFAAIFGPLLMMMGRDMWKSRRRERKMDHENPAPPEIDHDQIEAVEGPLTDPRRVPLPDKPRAAFIPPTAGEEVRSFLPGQGLTDGGAAAESFGVAKEQPSDEQRWAAEGIPDTEIMEMPIDRTPYGRGVARVPEPMVPATRIECSHCGGRGFVRGLNDYLRESIALIGDEPDEIIRLFYSSLLRANPQLMTLFPGDPTQGDFGSDHKGAKQRDKLLRALTALADLYDPGDSAKMEHLDQALASFGRAHASFTRQDGTVRGATLDEYAAVKEALFSTLVRVAGQKWLPEYTEAWSQAYDYAAAVMLTEQFRSGFVAPRFPREAR